VRGSFFLAIGKDWWLPPNYAVHGRETDALFSWFFWITFTVLVAVQILLVVFLLRYRRRPGRAATFVHGNARLEMLWTAIPAVILAVLAIASKRVWDDYRNSPDLQNPDRTTILVIARQFAWTAVYPGPDGKFGRYLVYPKPTDKLWPVERDGKRPHFANRDGPASPPDPKVSKPVDPVTAINLWIGQDAEHSIGKDFSDADGIDDEIKTAGAPIDVPVNRPVEVMLESLDVIHDFFLPNFRAQLYAVPGMRGRLVFTPTTTTAEVESASRETVDVQSLMVGGSGERVIDIDQTSAGAEDFGGWRYASGGKKKKGKTIVRDNMPVSAEAARQLLGAGVSKVRLHRPAPFEIACAQLCGELHSQMKGEMIVLSQEQFDRKHPAGGHARGTSP
jgi:heme/copper-type cytochrome/quinol oxidase subunit 2